MKNEKPADAICISGPVHFLNLFRILRDLLRMLR